MGLGRLAEKLQENRGKSGYRQIIAEMEGQGPGKIGACDLLRAEHGPPVAEDVYSKLCCWVGITPEELRAGEPGAEEPEIKKVPAHRGEV